LRVSRFPAAARLVLTVLLTLSHTNLGAQVTAQPEIVNRPDSSPVPPSTSAEPPLLPENPTPHRVIDKKFIAIMGTLGATESIRFATRQLVLENENSAGAPWATTVPSHTQLVIKYAPIFAAELVVAYEIKKHHDWLPGDRVIRKLWWVYPATMGAIHLHNALGNIHTQAPAGCPVADCQP
jgi:hypothetical protein